MLIIVSSLSFYWVNSADLRGGYDDYCCRIVCLSINRQYIFTYNLHSFILNMTLSYIEQYCNVYDIKSYADNDKIFIYVYIS